MMPFAPACSNTTAHTATGGRGLHQHPQNETGATFSAEQLNEALQEVAIAVI